MFQGKTHIHIENSDASHPVFVGTEQHARDLLARNPDLADQLHITIGSSDVDEVEEWSKEDLDEYFGYMQTADIMVGFTFPYQNIPVYAPYLRVIHFISSGVDHVAPFDWVPAGLKLVNNRGVHQPKSGESFAMFLAMLNAGIPRLVTSQRAHKWDKHFTTIIKGKTLVVIGIGNQGGEMARQARNLGLKVIGIHPRRTEHPLFDQILPPSRMQEAFADADFVSLNAPLTDETRNMLSREALGWLPKRAGIINVSRGPLLDERALAEKLAAGELSGAILDVFHTEPLPKDHFLWDTPNLIITPHVSSDDVVNYMPRTLDLTIENLRNEMAGRPLVNVVDTGREY